MMPKPCAARCVNVWHQRLAATLAACALAACSTPAPPPSVAHERTQAALQGAARAIERGQLPQARTLTTQALRSAQAVQDDGQIATALLNLAWVNGQLKDFPAAREALAPLLQGRERFGAGVAAKAAARRALLALDEGDTAAAAQYAGLAERDCAKPCDHAAAMASLRAHLALQAGSANLAASLAEQAAALAAASGQAAEQGHALNVLGRARLAAGQPGPAAAALAQALALHRRLGRAQAVAADLLALADAHTALGQAGAAREHLERALEVHAALGDTAAVARLRERLAALRP